MNIKLKLTIPLIVFSKDYKKKKKKVTSIKRS